MRRAMVGVALATVVAACNRPGNSNPDGGIAIDARRARANATLAALTASAGELDPPFEPDVTEYDLDLPLEQTDVAFTPVAATPDAVTVTVDGSRVDTGESSSPATLPMTLRVMTIAVTSPDGARTDYRIRIRRGADALASLSVSSGTMEPAFDPSISSYAIKLPLAVETIAMTPVPLYPERAMFSVGKGSSSSAPVALALGENLIAVRVTTRRGTSRTYTVSVLRGADALTSLQFDRAGAHVTNPLSPNFDPSIGAYTMTVGTYLSQLGVIPISYDPTASITVNGAPVVSGEVAPEIRLNPGLTEMVINVAMTGQPLRSYTLTVTRLDQVAREAFIKASNADDDDRLDGGPQRLSLWGNTMVVGASGEDSSATGVNGNQSDNSAENSGAAYAFVRNGTTWTQQAYLKASNTHKWANFGYAVAVWGDTIAVGAPKYGPIFTPLMEQGAVYIFRRTGTQWRQEAFLISSDPFPTDRFGYSLSLWNNTLIVGAPHDGGADRPGTAYVFQRVDNTWKFQARLAALNGDPGDNFGWSVGLWEDTAIIGAPYEESISQEIDRNPDNNDAPNSGAAYVFTRNGATWTQRAYLKSSNSEANDEFGVATSLWQNTIVVGARRESGGGTGTWGDPKDNSKLDSGASYIFERIGDTWRQRAYLKASTSDSQWFGISVSACGDTVTVGSEIGRAYVFHVREFFAWHPATTLQPIDTSSDGFGASVSCWADSIAVSAWYSGAVHVFR